MSAYWPLGGIWSKLRVTNLPAISGGIKSVTLLVFTMKVRHRILVTQGTHKELQLHKNSQFCCLSGNRWAPVTKANFHKLRNT